MKNLLLVLFIAGCITACDEAKKQPADAPVEKSAPSASKNSQAFNESFQKLLTSYYALKDALVEVDTAKANAASTLLAASANELDLAELITDSAAGIKETAKNYTATINGSALGLAGAADYAKKKKEFKMISDAMYDLVRTVKYDQEKIYHQHCPMAINDAEEAYWLSNNITVVNPYLGKKHPKYKDAMLGCGDVTDSLDFTK